MKILTTCLLLTVSLICTAPEYKTLYIQRSEAIEVFDPILYAFQFVESSFNPDTINSLGYGGILQIGQEMVDEVNRICVLNHDPRRFVLNDRLNVVKSNQMWYIVQHHWNPQYNVKKAAMIWNPLGTAEYYRRIKHVINTIKHEKN
jgi:hypothetical protein